MATAIERIDAQIEEWSEYIHSAIEAKKILSTFHVPAIEDCYPSVSCWKWENSLTIDVRYSLHTADRTWQQLARLIAQIRKAYGVERFERSVHAYSPTYVENSYSGTVNVGDGCTVNLSVVTSELPPKCSIQVTEEVVTKTVAKVVCA